MFGCIKIVVSVHPKWFFFSRGNDGPSHPKKTTLKTGRYLSLLPMSLECPRRQGQKCFCLKGIMYGCVFVVCLFIRCFLKVLSEREREVINKETVIWPVIKRRNSNPDLFLEEMRILKILTIIKTSDSAWSHQIGVEFYGLPYNRVNISTEWWRRDFYNHPKPKISKTGVHRFKHMPPPYIQKFPHPNKLGLCCKYFNAQNLKFFHSFWWPFFGIKFGKFFTNNHHS